MDTDPLDAPLDEEQNLIDLGFTSVPEIKEGMTSQELVTPNFLANSYEYSDKVSLYIKLKNNFQNRAILFKEIIEIEAREKGLIGEHGEIYIFNSIPFPHAICIIPIEPFSNNLKCLNLVLSGLEVRLNAAIGQADLIEINKIKKKRNLVLRNIDPALLITTDAPPLN